MSELQVTTLSVNNTINAVSIVAGNTVINATGIQLGSGGGVNTSAVFVNSALNVLTSNVNTASITIGGKTFTNIYETVNVQIFTANGTWTKPVWATDGKELVVVNMWGGGGGGAYGTGISSGGGGGAFAYGYFSAAQCNSVCNVVVGTAGAAGAGANATAGGDSVFWPNTTASLSAFGGGGGQGVTTPQAGGGGGWLSAGATALGSGGGPLGSNSTLSETTFGGGRGAVSNSTGWSSSRSVYGGAGGGSANATLTLNPSASIFGGGGGGAFSGSGGTSVYGGRGAGLANAAQNIAGIPGGGGAAAHSNNFSSAGARGEVRIYTYRILT